MSKEAAGGGGKTDSENEEEEFVAIEVDNNGKPVGVPDKDGAADDDGEQDASGLLGDDDEDEDDDPDAGDTRMGHSEEEELTDETPEARKERIKKERRARKIRNRVTQEARERLLANQGRLLVEATERIAKLEGRHVQYDINGLQQQLRNIEAQQTDAKSTLAALVKAGDGDGVAEVADIQAQLREQHTQTLNLLQRAKKAKQDGGEGEDGSEPAARARPNGKQPAAQPVDPEVKIRAEEWASDKPWLDPSKHPEDFAIVRAIDDYVIKTLKLDPRTDAYWTELTKRVQRRLPERFKRAGARPNPGNGSGNNGGRRVDNNDGQRPTGGPRMAASSQSGARALGKNEVRVTPARKEAMIAAGKWEDPVKRNRQLAAYAKYDKEQVGEQ